MSFGNFQMAYFGISASSLTNLTTSMIYIFLEEENYESVLGSADCARLHNRHG
jgi:hypothetical protein